MADDYNDRQRQRDEDARREAGELPGIPADAVALQALAEMAKRMGFGDTIADAISDAIGEVFSEHGIDRSESNRDEWLACFGEVETDAARMNTMQLCNAVVQAIAREERHAAATANPANWRAA
jgi:hypothetical protein